MIEHLLPAQHAQELNSIPVNRAMTLIIVVIAIITNALITVTPSQKRSRVTLHGHKNGYYGSRVHCIISRDQRLL